MAGRGPLALVVATVALSGAPATAHAAFTVDASPTAARPTVAVEAGGTAHVAWADRINPGADLLRYCRIPRGAKGCTGARTFAPDGKEAFGPTQVLLPAPGRVLLIGNRCCNTSTVLYESTDGGQTFAGPRPIGTIDPYEAELGPGPFSVSLVNNVVTDGIDFQAAPIAGGDPGIHADVGAPLGVVDAAHIQGYWGTVGFLNPVTSVVAFTDLNDAFFRVWGGSGDYNDTSTWGPTQPLGAGDETVLASGTSGLYVLYKVGSPGKFRYVVRRMSPKTQRFGSARRVSATGDPIFRDFFQDGEGRLHAAWIDNGGKDPLRYRASDDGATWSKIATLESATNDRAFNLRLATAADGGGLVVWDGNGAGPIRATVIPRRAGVGGGGSSCPKTLKITAKVTAVARTGCLARQKDGTYTSGGEVRINGIDFEPGGAGAGTAAHSAATAKIIIDPKKNTFRTQGSVDAKAGPVFLHSGALKWDFDQAVKFGALEKFKRKLLGFPVIGDADVAFVTGGAKIDANLKLPAFFGGVTGRTILRTQTSDPQGLLLDKVTVKVPEAFLGVLIVRDLKVVYDSQFSVFEGAAELVFPPQTQRGVRAAFGFKDGAFAHAEAEAGPPVPPFPLPLTTPPGPLFLKKVGIAVSAENGLRISGGAALTAGPPVGGTGIVRVNALPPQGFVFDFPAGKDYADLSVSGSLDLVGIPLAQGFLKFRTTGLLSFGGFLSLDLPAGLVGVRGDVKGFVNVASGAFNSSSSVHICAPASCKVGKKPFQVDTPLQGTGTWIVSSKGAAGCVSVAGAGIGAGLKWGKSFDVFADGGCDLGDYSVAAGGAARTAQAGVASVTFPAGLPQAGIKLRGAGGPPIVTVTGPKGERLQMDPANPDTPIISAPFVSYTVPEAQLTVVQLVKPSGGPWRIETQPGSPQIAELRSARGLPAVSISARVGGKRRSRTLEYSLRAIPGQTVTFLERAGRALGRVGTARGARGTLRFAPADGPAGRREIVALVEQDGIPRSERVVTRYVAPPSARPARPRVRARRRSGRLLISWSRSRGASGYVVRVRISDGRSLLYTRRSTRRSLRVSRFARGDSARVTVQGLARSGRRGRSGRVRVRAVRRR